MALVLAGRRPRGGASLRLAGVDPAARWHLVPLPPGRRDRGPPPGPQRRAPTSPRGPGGITSAPATSGLLEGMWPVVEAAVGFVLRLQQPGGEVLWSMDPDGHLGRYALLTSTSSIHHSLRCAIAMAECLGFERPEWELAADRMVEAIVHRPDSFRPQTTAGRWTGTTRSSRGPWPASRRASASTAGGRSSCSTGSGCAACRTSPGSRRPRPPSVSWPSMPSAGGPGDRRLLDWTRHLRHDDGGYWTGCVHPHACAIPGGERSTYTAAAVLLADHALYGSAAAPASSGARPSRAWSTWPASREPLPEG